MDLPDIIRAWAVALNEHDSQAFSKCFSEKAILYDHQKVHAGRKAIKRWAEQTSHALHMEIRPMSFVTHGTSVVLTAELSGTFPQGPHVLKYYFIISNGLIASLKISAK